MPRNLAKLLELSAACAHLRSRVTWIMDGQMAQP